MTTLDDFRDQAQAYMGALADLLPESYELTLVARHKTMPPEKNADILITRDDPEAVVAAIQRLVAERLNQENPDAR